MRRNGHIKTRDWGAAAIHQHHCSSRSQALVQLLSSTVFPLIMIKLPHS